MIKQFTALSALRLCCDLNRKVSARGVKLLFAVYEKTLRWDKATDVISLSQFVQMTGMTEPTVISAIKDCIAARLPTRFAFCHECKSRFSSKTDHQRMPFCPVCCQPRKKEFRYVPVFAEQPRLTMSEQPCLTMQEKLQASKATPLPDPIPDSSPISSPKDFGRQPYVNISTTEKSNKNTDELTPCRPQRARESTPASAGNPNECPFDAARREEQGRQWINYQPPMGWHGDNCRLADASVALIEPEVKVEQIRFHVTVWDVVRRVDQERGDGQATTQESVIEIVNDVARLKRDDCLKQPRAYFNDRVRRYLTEQVTPQSDILKNVLNAWRPQPKGNTPLLPPAIEPAGAKTDAEPIDWTPSPELAAWRAEFNAGFVIEPVLPLPHFGGRAE